MSIVVLDTNIVSYLMKGHSLAEAYRSHLEGNTLAISFMTIAELYEGAYRRNWTRKRRDGLKRLLKSYLVIPYSPRYATSGVKYAPGGRLIRFLWTTHG